MSSIHKSYRFLFWALAALSAGVVNYLLWRPGILLFSFLEPFRAHSISVNNSWTFLFFNGYFSDICWCAALCLATVAVNTKVQLSRFDKGLILMIPFLSEAGQYFSLIPGSFDWYDLFAYTITIIIFNSIFSSALIPVYMKKLPASIASISLSLVFLIMAFACATTQRTSYRSTPAPDPCVRHGALSYSPVLVQINIDGSYTMKDLSGAQRSGQTYFMDALKAVNPYKYQLADGVTPNLNIYITINTDSYQHYGAKVTFYVHDDNTWFSMASNYVEPYRLFDDIAAKINTFVMYGWTHGKCS